MLAWKHFWLSRQGPNWSVGRRTGTPVARRTGGQTNRITATYDDATTYGDLTLYVEDIVIPRRSGIPADRTVAESLALRSTGPPAFRGTGGQTNRITASYDDATNYGDLTLYAEEVIIPRRTSVSTPRRS